MINKDFKLVETFVKKVFSGLKKVGNTCKLLEEEVFRIPKNLFNKLKMQCDISFTWEKHFWL